MSSRERILILSVLFSILVMVSFDLLTDSREGASWWHLLAEGIVVLAAIFGLTALLRGSFKLRTRLEQEIKTSERLRDEAIKWQAQSKKYLLGLSQAIDQQLSDWQLTTAEKEVAFLLLKGLSLKEIAEIRETTEKTARAQSAAIYSKSNLTGRSELAAFFLEDLLLPADDFKKNDVQTV